MSKHIKSHFAEYDLAQWLSYIESIHSTEIDMGLTRIANVLALLNINFDFAKVITVAGTNGKGTTCAFMENAFISEGHKVAVYSSPHIERFNERLRIDKAEVIDQYFIDAFALIEHTRGDISLTYYEFTTLAAFVVLMQTKPDIIILEVGLGGRLDATNVIDADIAVVTTIDIDHQAFLGDTRELIAVEKAGIMRTNGLAVIGDLLPPQTLIDYVDANGVNARWRNRDFVIESPNSTWSWSNSVNKIDNLNQPYIPRDNVATALMVLSLAGVALNEINVNQWITQTKVAGRTEVFPSTQGEQADVMLDVGHNLQAARYLANHLKKSQYHKIYAVLGMLKDKDIVGTIDVMQPQVDEWFVGGLDVPRGASKQELKELINLDPSVVNYFDNIPYAFKMAQQSADKNDLVLVFGSFFTVAEIRRALVIE